MAKARLFHPMNITVPPELKKRIRKAGDTANWSAVACAAFEVRLSEIDQRRDPKPMSPALETALIALVEHGYEYWRVCTLPVTDQEPEPRHVYAIGKVAKDGHMNPLMVTAREGRNNTLKFYTEVPGIPDQPHQTAALLNWLEAQQE